MNIKFFVAESSAENSDAIVCSIASCKAPAIAQCDYKVSEKTAVIYNYLPEEDDRKGFLACIYLCGKHKKSYKAPVGWDLTVKRAKKMSDETPKNEAKSTPLLDRAFANKRR